MIGTRISARGPRAKQSSWRAIAIGVFAIITAALWSLAAPAQTLDARIAFVVGNGGYVKAPLATAVNDAGLVAEALRSIGFDVVEGADINQTDFSRSFRQFLAKVDAGGSNAIAVMYFAGYGFEFDGDNFWVMADARLERDSDIPLDTVRLSDLLRGLAGTPARAKVLMSDASRRLPFAIQDLHLATGLGAVDAPRRTLIAYSAAPGMIADDGPGPYGAFASAAAEMLRSPGLELSEIVARIRARTHQATQGLQSPWDVSSLSEPLVLVPADGKTAPSPTTSAASLGARPIRERGPEDAYAAALKQDTLASYGDFLQAYPRHADAPRIRAMIRVRREAMLWLRAVKLNTAPAIWSYLRRYPEGMYVGDAGRRLGRLSAPLTPPPDFVPVEFRDVPSPLSDEPAQNPALDHLIRPPTVLSEPPPAYLATLAPPTARIGAHVLPTPMLPAITRLTAGMRRPLASLTGLPGVAGPVATNASQSSHPPAENAVALASAPAAVAVNPPNPPLAAAAIPLPTPAPERAAGADKSHRVLASRHCRIRRGQEFCR